MKYVTCPVCKGSRLKAEWLQTRKGDTLYLLDEPSTGLHQLDLLRLIEVFQSIIDQGDTWLYIEHNRDLIQAANEVITLGPGSEELGGRLISTEKNSE